MINRSKAIALVNKIFDELDEPKFKAGDWIVRNIGDTVQWHELLANYDSIKLWKPTVGKLVCAYSNINRITVRPYNESLPETYNHIRPLEFIQTLED